MARMTMALLDSSAMISTSPIMSPPGETEAADAAVWGTVARVVLALLPVVDLLVRLVLLDLLVRLDLADPPYSWDRISARSAAVPFSTKYTNTWLPVLGTWSMAAIHSDTRSRISGQRDTTRSAFMVTTGMTSKLPGLTPGRLYSPPDFSTWDKSLARSEASTDFTGKIFQDVSLKKGTSSTPSMPMTLSILSAVSVMMRPLLRLS